MLGRITEHRHCLCFLPEIGTIKGRLFLKSLTDLDAAAVGVAGTGGPGEQREHTR